MNISISNRIIIKVIIFIELEQIAKLLKFKDFVR